MNKSPELESNVVVITDNAVEKLKVLIAQEDNASSVKLRVYVSGGGCAGFQYGFKFDANSIDGDTEVEKDGVCVVIDPMSIQYLQGAEVDYVEGLQGAQFVVRNPNASTTCGCGSSFSV